MLLLLLLFVCACVGCFRQTTQHTQVKKRNPDIRDILWSLSGDPNLEAITRESREWTVTDRIVFFLFF